MSTGSTLVAMRLYITSGAPDSVDGDVKDPSLVTLPTNLTPFLRYARPNVQGLVEQAADEAMALGRLGVGTCGSRDMVTDVKNAVVGNLRKDLQDIYCHAEEFEF